jgi:hypothetical protein
VIPSAWIGVVLALATYRLVRLLGWDDFPPVARARAWVTGEHWVPVDSATEAGGKTPDRGDYVQAAYRRPMLAHFLHCAFCQGFWMSALVYTAWVVFPTETLYALAPFALSGVVGLLAKNLDG